MWEKKIKQFYTLPAESFNKTYKQSISLMNEQINAKQIHSFIRSFRKRSRFNGMSAPRNWNENANENQMKRIIYLDGLETGINFENKKPYDWHQQRWFSLFRTPLVLDKSIEIRPNVECVPNSLPTYIIDKWTQIRRFWWWLRFISPFVKDVMVQNKNFPPILSVL